MTPSVFNAEESSPPRRVFAARTVLACLALCLLVRPARAAVSVSETAGAVQLRKPGSDVWGAITKNHILSPGDEIKTARGSHCTVVFDDGSKVEIGPNGSFVLEEAVPESSSLRLQLGFLTAWVTKTLTHRFQVRTPTAVCSVRGTEWDTDVRENGDTLVKLRKGSLAVADFKGNAVLLSPGQQIGATHDGLGRMTRTGETRTSEREKGRLALKREVGLQMTKEEVQAAAALEQKTAVYKDGKAIIDVNGNRVRMEQYIIRPADNQFKLVVLNQRVDRFDYFYYLGTFNKTLPMDMKGALSQLGGQANVAPEFFLKAFETGRSNTTDSVQENGTGGHLVDLNNDGEPNDAVPSAYDPRTDRVVLLAPNQPFFGTIFDSYTLKFDGVIHHSWALAAGVTPYDGATAYSAGNLTGARRNNTTQLAYTDNTNLIKPPGCNDNDSCTLTGIDGKAHDKQYLQNGPGTVWEKFDNYIINDQGKVGNLADFAGVQKGADFKTMLLNWNYEQIVTASEFNGRKIDLAVAPKILIQSGLIP